MQRCVDLARRAEGNVAPNPMVGAVLIHDNEIIGEGCHEAFGGPHAEVNCMNSVPTSKQQFISRSTLYVSLEPCAHFGKTPPCAELIIKNSIPKVIIGCRDPFIEVNGKGIEKLKSAGIEVITGILGDECKLLNRRFFTYHIYKRPYVILKWAETADKKIGHTGNNRLLITNDITNRLVHKWRNQESGIMIGTNTAAFDDPQLTNRLWSGKNPVRIIVDRELRLPASLRIFDGTVKTILFNYIVHEENENIIYYQVTDDVSTVHQVLNGLYALKILSVIVEGGAQLIQSFIDEGSWDEARVIKNTTLIQGNGIPSPKLLNEKLIRLEKFREDEVRYFQRVNGEG